MRDLWSQCWHQTAAKRSLGSAPFLQERQPLSALWGRWMEGNSVPTQSLSKPLSRSKGFFLGLSGVPKFCSEHRLGCTGRFSCTRQAGLVPSQIPLFPPSFPILHPAPPWPQQKLFQTLQLLTSLIHLPLHQTSF